MLLIKPSCGCDLRKSGHRDAKLEISQRVRFRNCGDLMLIHRRMRTIAGPVPSEDPSATLAITVDPEVHRQVVEAAAAEGVSVSNWMVAAASRQLKIRDGLMHEFHCAHQECGSQFTASDRYYLMRQV